ncbi:hypothetical protein [Paenibacillus sp. GYB003]|uniref:hypothetical protein n=1 Tax=Paenibacillus sp. GYB003 TaxID=2994392 RepID=UPI002F96AB3F
MGRLKKYAKKSKEEYHQYPWKVDYELFALFSKYCESLNLSVNEALSLLVSDEIESFKQELSEEGQTAILDEYRSKRGIFLREGPPSCIHPEMHRGPIPPGRTHRRDHAADDPGDARRGGGRGRPRQAPGPDIE